MTEFSVGDRKLYLSPVMDLFRASDWTLGGAFWEVGVPTTSDRPEVTAARAAMDEGLTNQRRGV